MLLLQADRGALVYFFPANCKCILAGWSKAHIRACAVYDDLSIFAVTEAVCCGKLTSCADFRLPDFEQFRQSTFALVLVARLASTCVQSTDTGTHGQTRGLLAKCRASEPGELMLGSAYLAPGSSGLCSLRLS